MSFDPTTAQQTVAAVISYEILYDQTQIVQEFVYRYYLTLTEAPHEAWRNYTVAAQYMHVDGEVTFLTGGNDLKPAVGHHQIHANIMYQRFDECEFHILSISVQQTPAAAATASTSTAATSAIGTTAAAHMVLVTGYISRNRSAPVTFVQSFLIECIHEINQYAICNTILKVFAVV